VVFPLLVLRGDDEGLFFGDASGGWCPSILILYPALGLGDLATRERYALDSPIRPLRGDIVGSSGDDARVAASVGPRLPLPGGEEPRGRPSAPPRWRGILLLRVFFVRLRLLRLVRRFERADADLLRLTVRDLLRFPVLRFVVFLLRVIYYIIYFFIKYLNYLTFFARTLSFF
jgi:hypothetical protein